MDALFAIFYSSLLTYAACVIAIAHTDPSNPSGALINLVTLGFYRRQVGLPPKQTRSSKPAVQSRLSLAERCLVNPQLIATMAVGLVLPLLLLAYLNGAGWGLLPDLPGICPGTTTESLVPPTRGSDMWPAFMINTCLPLSLVLAGAQLRLQAYKTLGKDFTFALRRPPRLVRNGPYRYLRHPSYTGLIMIWIGALFLGWMPDGPVLACFISSPSPRYAASTLIFTIYIAVRAAVMGFRCPREEKMMMEQFGEEYVRYKKEVWGLIPGVW